MDYWEMNDIFGIVVNKYLWFIGFFYMYKIYSMVNYEDRFLF